MASELIFLPEVLNLSFYAGDGVSFKLVCTDSKNSPVDITGDVSAQIRIDRVSEVAPVTSFSSNMVDAYLGIITLSLTGVQTNALIDHSTSRSDRFSGVWDVQWTPSGSQPRTLCQGTVDCVADVTR